MQIRNLTRLVVTLCAALVLSLVLTACGSDSSSSEKASNSAPNTSDTDDSDEVASDAGSSAELSEALRDFPLPAEYTLRTAGSRDGATTAILYNIPGDWEETKAFYEAELPKAGWELTGDRPFAGQDGTELDATKNGTEASVAITSVNSKSGLTINLIEP